MHNVRSKFVMSLLTIAIFYSSFLFLKAVYEIQFIEAKYFTSQAMSYRLKETTLKASRGTIFDTNLIPIVTNSRGFDVGIIPRDIKNIDEVSESLSVILGINSDDLKDRINKQDSFFYIARNIDYRTGVELISWKMSGLILEETNNRILHQNSFEKLIGTVDPDGIGIEGLELYFNNYLSGQDGKIVYESAPNGRIIPQADIQTTLPIHGEDLILTINSELQFKAGEVCSEAIKRTNSMNCSIAFSDAKTGDVIILVEKSNENVSHISSDLMNLRAYYEPGSSLKIFTIGALIEKDNSYLDVVFNVPDKIEIIKDSCNLNNKINGCFRDFKNHENYNLKLENIIERSSNVGTILATSELSISEIESYLSKYGFMSKTGINLTGELPGRISSNKSCSTCLASLSIGYSIDVTQLQMLRAYSIIANGGKDVTLSLIKDELSNVQNNNSVVNKDHAKVLKEFLVNVVQGDNGTAKILKSIPHVTGGKTGTSRTYIEGSGYSENLFTTSFIGFTEFEDTTVVGSIILWGASINPSSEYITGGSTAAPLYKEMIEYFQKVGG